MSRKTRREPRRGKKMAKTVDNIYDFFNGPAKGFQEDEMNEIFEWILFHEDFMFNCFENKQEIDFNYAFDLDEITYFLKGHNMKTSMTKALKLDMYLTILSAEAEKKGFDSILTYVRFLGMTLLDENGVYSIVNEDEQKHIKRGEYGEKLYDEMGILC